PPRPPLFPYSTLFRSSASMRRIVAAFTRRMSATSVHRTHPSRVSASDSVAARIALAIQPGPLTALPTPFQITDHRPGGRGGVGRSEEHTSTLQSPYDL